MKIEFFPLLRLLVFVLVVAAFFAQVEIQIEGSAGWAASLPTWRVEKHWLLEIFWGGRAMTGYHAWVFSFMALVFRQRTRNESSRARTAASASGSLSALRAFSVRP